MHRHALFVSLLISASLCLACSGRDRDGGPTGGANLISAAEGGTVQAAGTTTRIEIPAGSLAEDTEIVLTLDTPDGYPAYDDLRDVMVIEPAGLALEIPAIVHWQPSGATLDGTEGVLLLELVDGAWRRSEVSAAPGSGGIVTTTLYQLGTYGLVVVPRPAGPTGDVSGNVLHIYTEEPLPGIGIEVVDSAGTSLGSTESGADGTFSLTGIPVGEHTIRADVAEADNCFGDPTEKPVTVTEGSPASVFFGFVPGPC